jgi:thiamine kinase-like enzyme
VFAQAVELALPAVTAIDTPLAFSSGDYNPGNFLWDGERVTGFIDFTWACFEDPYISFAKYWLHDWFPLHKAGLVEHYLETQGLTLADFAPRLAVRCLWTLQREIPVTDVEGTSDYTRYRERVLGLLRRALHALR